MRPQRQVTAPSIAGRKKLRCVRSRWYPIFTLLACVPWFFSWTGVVLADLEGGTVRPIALAVLTLLTSMSLLLALSGHSIHPAQCPLSANVARIRGHVANDA